MDIQKKIDSINALKLDNRIEHIEELLEFASKFKNLNNNNETLGLKVINCLQGIRSSRFIDSDMDLKLLDASLTIARNLNTHKKLLIGLINDAIYYSNYYPKKYNKSDLEKELKTISSSTT